MMNNGFTIIHSRSQLRYQIRVLMVLQNTNLIKYLNKYHFFISMKTVIHSI